MKIAILYQDLLNIYGNNGNINVICKALSANENLEVVEYSLGNHPDISDCDFVYCGYGTENRSVVALDDLFDIREALREMAENEVPMMFLGTSYGMLLDEIIDLNKKRHSGLSLVKGTVSYDEKRRYSEFIMNCSLADNVVGNINTSSVYDVQANLFEPVFDSADLLHGDKEGSVYKNVFGTELVGPLLWRNPHLLEKFTSLILKREVSLDELDWFKQLKSGYQSVLNILSEHKN